MQDGGKEGKAPRREEAKGNTIELNVETETRRQEDDAKQPKRGSQSRDRLQETVVAVFCA